MGIYIIMGATYLVQAYYFAMIYYIIGSWVPALMNNPIGQFVAKIVEPYLAIFRKFIPPLGMIDISPILAFIVYNFLSNYLKMGIVYLVQLIGL